MSDIIFIFGAGASADAGAPLMANFLDKAWNLLKYNQVPDAEKEFKLTFRGIDELYASHARANLDTNSLEAVFSAFEMAKLLGRLGTMDQKDVEQLPAAIRTTITRTIERLVEFPMGGNGMQAPKPYGAFMEALKAHITGSDDFSRLTFITFNYDLCLDFMLFRSGMEVDYGLNENGRAGAVRLYKLHGSLNWWRCSECNYIQIYKLKDHHGQIRRFNIVQDERERFKKLELSREFHPTHCLKKQALAPYIVPPTGSKGEHHRELSQVWKAAGTQLQAAEYVIVVGYSLPETDQFFRYLWALSTVGATGRLKEFVVIDNDETGAVEKRFADLLGPVAKRGFKVHQMTFEQVSHQILPHLRTT